MNGCEHGFHPQDHLRLRLVLDLRSSPVLSTALCFPSGAVNAETEGHHVSRPSHPTVFAQNIPTFANSNRIGNVERVRLEMATAVVSKTGRDNFVLQPAFQLCSQPEDGAT